MREAVSLSYEAALREHVIDVVADDLPDLLHAADGRMVVAGGRPVRLATADADCAKSFRTGATGCWRR